MKNNKSKWLIYVVLVGLIPSIARAVVWYTSKIGTLDFFAATDFISFGLILHISNINELEHVTDDVNKDWKTSQNGISLVFVAIYSILSAILLSAEKDSSRIDMDAMKVLTGCLAVISFSLSFSIFDRLAKLSEIPKLQKVPKVMKVAEVPEKEK